MISVNKNIAMSALTFVALICIVLTAFMTGCSQPKEYDVYYLSSNNSKAKELIEENQGRLNSANLPNEAIAHTTHYFVDHKDKIVYGVRVNCSLKGCPFKDIPSNVRIGKYVDENTIRSANETRDCSVEGHAWERCWTGNSYHYVCRYCSEVYFPKDRFDYPSE